MNDLISREAAIKAVVNGLSIKPSETVVRKIIEAIPAADISEQLENAYAHGYTAAEAEFRKLMEEE